MFGWSSVAAARDSFWNRFNCCLSSIAAKGSGAVVFAKLRRDRADELQAIETAGQLIGNIGVRGQKRRPIWRVACVERVVVFFQSGAQPLVRLAGGAHAMFL